MGKIYEVTRSTGRQIGVLVKLEGSTGGARLLEHCVFHSPDGFETGYGGSGPADLALSILADFFGATPKQIAAAIQNSWQYSESTAQGRALKLHQTFKHAFIAPRRLEPGESYEITGEDISQWVAPYLRHSIDTETLRCSCGARMCFTCGGCSKMCDCPPKEN